MLSNSECITITNNKSNGEGRHYKMQLKKLKEKL